MAQGSKRTLAIPDLSRLRYLDLHDTRLMLEGLAVERAVETATDKNVAEVEAACAITQVASDVGDREAYAEANWRFYLGMPPRNPRRDN